MCCTEEKWSRCPVICAKKRGLSVHLSICNSLNVGANFSVCAVFYCFILEVSALALYGESLQLSLSLPLTCPYVIGRNWRPSRIFTPPPLFFCKKIVAHSASCLCEILWMGTTGLPGGLLCLAHRLEFLVVHGDKANDDVVLEGNSLFMSFRPTAAKWVKSFF